MTCLMILVLPRPAFACSCAWPPDVQRSLERSPAAFIGTVIRTDTAALGLLGQEATYVFEVEHWAKGGPGRTIEIQAPVDTGGNCGLNLKAGDRVSMILYESEGHLTSNSCTTFEPDMLLGVVATIPEPDSESMVPWLVLAAGDVFEVRDRQGRLVARLDSRRSHEEFGLASPDYFSVCPGGKRFVHVTSATLAIWDAQTLEILEQIDLGGTQGWEPFCRDEEAGDILLSVAQDGGYAVIDPVSGETIIGPGAAVVGIGATHAAIEDGVGGVALVELETEDLVVLVPVSLDASYYSVAEPNPWNETTAVLTSPVVEDSRPTLRIFRHGDLVEETELDTAAELVGWLDETTLLVIQSPSQDLLALDVTGDVVARLEATPAWAFAVEGHAAVTVIGTEVVRFDPRAGTREIVATLPEESAGLAPVMVLAGSEPVEEPHTVLTVPPIAEASDEAPAETALVARIVLGAMVVFATGAALVVARRRRSVEEQ